MIHTFHVYGGGLAIGVLEFSSGLADAAGRALAAWLPGHATFSLTLLFGSLLF